MAAFLFWISLIASIIFPGALVGVLKAIKNEEDTKWYTIILSICLFVITFTILIMLRQGLNFG
jgi:hypothetical protein